MAYKRFACVYNAIIINVILVGGSGGSYIVDSSSRMLFPCEYPRIASRAARSGPVFAWSHRSMVPHDSSASISKNLITNGGRRTPENWQKARTRFTRKVLSEIQEPTGVEESNLKPTTVLQWYHAVSLFFFFHDKQNDARRMQKGTCSKCLEA